MQIPFGSWFVITDNNNNPVAALVDGNAFSGALFPPTFPVTNDTVIGAAELAGDMTTRDITSLLFNNVYLYDGTPDNCSVAVSTRMTSSRVFPATAIASAAT